MCARHLPVFVATWLKITPNDAIDNIRNLRIINYMKALFVELPAFQRFRQEYLSDEAYRGLQNEMLKAPEAGDVITGTGGLRKVRHGDAKRGKGKSGGLRVIYFWWEPRRQFWLFTLYDKAVVSG
jgi:hypothetical protein